MLYSVNYLTHLNVIRADLMAEIGGWAMGVDGAQDWDLFLRATEKAACIVRAPGVGLQLAGAPGTPRPRGWRPSPTRSRPNSGRWSATRRAPDCRAASSRTSRRDFACAGTVWRL